MTDVRSILEERGRAYGEFREVAEVCRNLKFVVRDATERRVLDAYMDEALDMICMKIARIVCGDSTHIDSWLDIAGYAMLAVNELEKLRKGKE